MAKIVEIQLNHLAHRISERQVSLTWSSEVVELLAEEGYDPYYGARPLKRLIQQKIVNMLSKSILEGKIHPHSHINLLVSGKEIVYEVETKTKKQEPKKSMAKR
jgi:ATP-dependent Clp protease ATP-binding subunit ClpB